MRGELGSRATAAAVFSSSVPWILATSSRMLTWAYRCFTVESPTVRRSTGSAAVILSMRFGVPSGYVLRARRKEDTASDELRGKRSWDSLWRSREEAAEDGMGLVSVTPGSSRIQNPELPTSTCARNLFCAGWRLQEALGALHVGIPGSDPGIRTTH